jgi:hypothetical protein
MSGNSRGMYSINKPSPERFRVGSPFAVSKHQAGVGVYMAFCNGDLTTATTSAASCRKMKKNVPLYVQFISGGWGFRLCGEVGEERVGEI